MIYIKVLRHFGEETVHFYTFTGASLFPGQLHVNDSYNLQDCLPSDNFDTTGLTKYLCASFLTHWGYVSGSLSIKALSDPNQGYVANIGPLDKEGGWSTQT